MNPDQQAAAREVLAEMQDWLHLSLRSYKGAVFLFALRLPPDKLIEALWVAEDRIPHGGLDGFKYFCGVCHRMIREIKGDLARN